MTRSKSQPTWMDVKLTLAPLDRAGLLGLIHDLYTATTENRHFLHARLRLGKDVLQPYKEAMDRWLWPDALRNQDVSVAKAKRAIASYRKAVGDPAGMAELLVFYCEQAAGFSSDLGYRDEGYLNALVAMFKQALVNVAKLPAAQRRIPYARLDRTREISHCIGYGVGDDMDSLFAKYGKSG